MQKWWSFLFGGVMTACTVSVLITPMMGWGLPKNVSTYGGKIDNLFHLILFITGFFFVLTEALLVYFMYKYAGAPGPRVRPPAEEEKPSAMRNVFKPITNIIHDQHRLEMAWTLVPGVILIVIALVQIQTWLEIKDKNWMPKPGQLPHQMEVNARQFEWRIRYPSAERMAAWESNPDLAKDFIPLRTNESSRHEDDVQVINEIHVWKGTRVLVYLTTRDVIHSLYFPNLRLKQDALPGKTIPVWFEAIEANTKYDEETQKWVDGYKFNETTGEWSNKHEPQQVWELACAELCGWGHYKMQGRLYVHETKEDYLKWLEHATQEQRRSQPEETKPAAQ